GSSFRSRPVEDKSQQILPNQSSLGGFSFSPDAVEFFPIKADVPSVKILNPNNNQKSTIENLNHEQNTPTHSTLSLASTGVTIKDFQPTTSAITSLPYSNITFTQPPQLTQFGTLYEAYPQSYKQLYQPHHYHHLSTQPTSPANKMLMQQPSKRIQPQVPILKTKQNATKAEVHMSSVNSRSRSTNGPIKEVKIQNENPSIVKKVVASEFFCEAGLKNAFDREDKSSQASLSLKNKMQISNLDTKSELSHEDISLNARNESVKSSAAINTKLKLAVHAPEFIPSFDFALAIAEPQVDGQLEFISLSEFNSWYEPSTVNMNLSHLTVKSKSEESEIKHSSEISEVLYDEQSNMDVSSDLEERIFTSGLSPNNKTQSSTSDLIDPNRFNDVKYMFSPRILNRNLSKFILEDDASEVSDELATNWHKEKELDFSKFLGFNNQSQVKDSNANLTEVWSHGSMSYDIKNETVDSLNGLKRDQNKNKTSLEINIGNTNFISDSNQNSMTSADFAITDLLNQGKENLDLPNSVDQRRMSQELTALNNSVTHEFTENLFKPLTNFATGSKKPTKTKRSSTDDHDSENFPSQNNNSQRNNCESRTIRNITHPHISLEDPNNLAEMDLLQISKDFDQIDNNLPNTPVFTYDSLNALKECTKLHTLLSKQYGLFGRVLKQCIPTRSVELGSGTNTSKTDVSSPVDPRLYMNTSVPFSTVVCGLPGTGKSHSVAVMLENMLIPESPEIGKLTNPFSALVLHFDTLAIGSAFSLPRKPCEYAYIGVRKFNRTTIKVPAVTVLVMPSSFKTMQEIYAPLGSNIVIKPLYISTAEINVNIIMAIMQVSLEDEIPPYIHDILDMMRKIDKDFTWAWFQDYLAQIEDSIDASHYRILRQRVSILESFLLEKMVEKEDPVAKDFSKRNGKNSEWFKHRFNSQSIIVCDFSDPFFTADLACSLFEIVVGLFVAANIDCGNGVSCGRVIVLDEAHKYSNGSDVRNKKSSDRLISSLMSLIRHQHYLAMRIIISTQEPTAIPSKILELVNFVVVHRLSSPNWWEHLAKHVCSRLQSPLDDALFDVVVTLNTGNALLFSSQALVAIKSESVIDEWKQQNERNVDYGSNHKGFGKLGRGYLIVATRHRITVDGGKSIMALK
ncbi:hypothetical protein HK096_003306, partial [Nowakowskiella sp. JEL0078]